ncbi:MAG: DUF1835 domain-containing protein [Rhizobiales bacterium]|nr:DUF1835 domain-containing protein [Hyphomicrobiales bacterium]
MDDQLHVVFGLSAAHTLKLAFAYAGRGGRIMPLHDTFDLGPVAQHDDEKRLQWLEAAHPGHDCRWIVDGDRLLLAESLSAERPPIAWFSPDSAPVSSGGCRICGTGRAASLPCRRWRGSRRTGLPNGSTATNPCARRTVPATVKNGVACRTKRHPCG